MDTYRGAPIKTHSKLRGWSVGDLINAGLVAAFFLAWLVMVWVLWTGGPVP